MTTCIEQAPASISPEHMAFFRAMDHRIARIKNPGWRLRAALVLHLWDGISGLPRRRTNLLTLVSRFPAKGGTEYLQRFLTAAGPEVLKDPILMLEAADGVITTGPTVHRKRIVSLLKVGDAEGAGKMAALAPRQQQHALRRIIETGLLPSSRKGLATFVYRVNHVDCLAKVPASAPLVDYCAESFLRTGEVAWAEMGERIMADLPGPIRREVQADWARVIARRQGRGAALAFVRGLKNIKPRNRALAGLCRYALQGRDIPGLLLYLGKMGPGTHRAGVLLDLVDHLLEKERFSLAERFLNRIPTGCREAEVMVRRLAIESSRLSQIDHDDLDAWQIIQADPLWHLSNNQEQKEKVRRALCFSGFVDRWNQSFRLVRGISPTRRQQSPRSLMALWGLRTCFENRAREFDCRFLHDNLDWKWRHIHEDRHALLVLLESLPLDWLKAKMDPPTYLVEALEGLRLIKEITSFQTKSTMDPRVHQAMWLGMQGISPAWIPDEGRNPLRAAYDEGLSHSSRAAGLRKRLLRASGAVLSRIEPGSHPQIVGSRIRLLQNYGGGAAAAQFQRALKHQTDPNNVKIILEGFVQMDPRKAVRAFFKMIPLELDWPKLSSLLQFLEESGALPAGFQQKWQALMFRLQPHRDQAFRWPIALFAERPDLLDQGTEVLAFLESRLKGRGIPRTPMDLLNDLEKQMSPLFQGPRLELPATLLRDRQILEAVIHLEPANPGSNACPWDSIKWAKMLKTIHRRDIELDVPTVVRQIAELRDPAPGLSHQLIQGSWPFGQAISIPQMSGYRLRWLDKRKDLLTFLRLADSVPCCFNSQSRYNIDGPKWIGLLWLDPLSFCFHLEQEQSGRWYTRGFVFGSLGQREPCGGTVFFNGLYLQKSNKYKRAAIFTALENGFAKPLGCRYMAMANVHGGNGWMPREYKKEVVWMRRARALRQKGRLMTHVYDDISFRTNVSIRGYELYWKEI